MRTGRRRPTAAVVLAAALAAAVGCSPRTTTVNGTVSFNGKKMVWGGVGLVAHDGSAHQGAITPEGTYTIPNVPVGPAQVGVTTFDPNPKGDNEGRRWKSPNLPPGAWFPIPEKYADPVKSGLTVDVASGKPLDIDLK